MNCPDRRRRWALAPLQSLLLALIALMCATAVAVLCALQGPWLGLTLDEYEHGVRVVRVDPHGPSFQRIAEGDQLTGLVAAGRLLSLEGYRLSSQPHASPTFAGYHDFLQREDQVASALRGEEVVLQRAGQPPVSVAPSRDRRLASLPLEFWLLHFYGLLACMIGVSVWVFLPHSWPARLLALSGFSMFVATWQHSLWEARELALPGAVFDALMQGNHLALHGLLLCLLHLMVLYPQPLPHARRWILLSTLLVALVLLNEAFGVVQWPFHTFYLPLLFYYVGGTWVAIRQWRRSRHLPEERGALRWVILSTLLTMGMGMVVYFLPVILDVPPMASPSTMVGLVVTLYLGFALGILRYRLFQLERWWFVAWLWFLGGLSVLLVDAAIITFFGLQPVLALGMSVLLVGWGYFPARQWALRRLSSVPATSMEHYMPVFVAALYDCAPERVGELWRELLQQLFRPLSLDHVPQPLEQARLAQNGALLLVPDLECTDSSLSLRYSQGGRRLFSARDQAIARALAATAARINEVRKARESGAQQERHRIMRDLHDEVGGRLLSLILTAPDENSEKLARKAMSALRETIYVLDHNRRYRLDEVLDDWRDDLLERLAPLDCSLSASWPAEAAAAHHHLTPRQYVNLRRVLDEAVTNALKHGCDKRMELVVALQSEPSPSLQLTLTNPCRSGAAFEPDDLLPGHGLDNIRNRMAELDGTAEVIHSAGASACFSLQVRMPL